MYIVSERTHQNREAAKTGLKARDTVGLLNNIGVWEWQCFSKWTHSTMSHSAHPLEKWNGSGVTYIPTDIDRATAFFLAAGTRTAYQGRITQTQKLGCSKNLMRQKREMRSLGGKALVQKALGTVYSLYCMTMVDILPAVHLPFPQKAIRSSLCWLCGTDCRGEQMVSSNGTGWKKGSGKGRNGF